MKVCLFLLAVIACPDEKPVAVSDFCALAARDIAKLDRMTAEELKPLRRERKNAIARLRRNNDANCKSKR